MQILSAPSKSTTEDIYTDWSEAMISNKGKILLPNFLLIDHYWNLRQFSKLTM